MECKKLNILFRKKKERKGLLQECVVISSRPVLLEQMILILRVQVEMFTEMWGCQTGDTRRIRWGESRGAINHLIKHSIAATENFPAPNVNNAKLEQFFPGNKTALVLPNKI